MGQCFGHLLLVTFIWKNLPARSKSPFLKPHCSPLGPWAFRSVTTGTALSHLGSVVEGCLEPGVQGPLPSAALRALGGAKSLWEGNVLGLEFYCLRICSVFFLASWTLSCNTHLSSQVLLKTKQNKQKKPQNKKPQTSFLKWNGGKDTLKTAWIHNSIGCFSFLFFFKMLEPMAFLFMPPTKYSRNPRGPDSGFHPPSPLPQAREPGACQVLLLMILWGRPEGPRTLALDPDSRSRTLLLLGGRRGLPPPPRGRGAGGGGWLGAWETPCNLGPGEKWKGGWGWGTGMFLNPCESKRSGKEGRPWGSQGMRQALGRLVLRTRRPACEWPSEHLPHPVLGLGWTPQVAKGTDLAHHVLAFLRWNGLQIHLGQLSPVCWSCLKSFLCP